jgi:hypothetical protein
VLRQLDATESAIMADHCGPFPPRECLGLFVHELHDCIAGAPLGGRLACIRFDSAVGHLFLSVGRPPLLALLVLHYNIVSLAGH